MKSKKIKKELIKIRQYFKHPVIGLKFDILNLKLTFTAGIVKAYWNNGLYIEALEMAKGKQLELDKLALLLADLYDTDFNHVRTEINMFAKYPLMCYVNKKF